MEGTNRFLQKEPEEQIISSQDVMNTSLNYDDLIADTSKALQQQQNHINRENNRLTLTHNCFKYHPEDIGLPRIGIKRKVHIMKQRKLTVNYNTTHKS